MLHLSCFLRLSLAIVALQVGAGAAGTTKPTSPDVPTGAKKWHTDYALAMKTAVEEGKLLLVFFHGPEPDPACRRFESSVLTDPEVAAALDDYVCVKLPRDVEIQVGGKPVTLLEHPSYKGMSGRSGIAVLDYAHPGAKYYGCVVSAHPFLEDRCLSARQMAILLRLPPGMPDDRKRRYDAEEALAEIRWHTDYDEAVVEAQREGKMLFIWFTGRGRDPVSRRFERNTLTNEAIRRKLRDYVCAWLPLGAQTNVDGKPVTLLAHPAFREMLGRPGMAILDYTERGSETYGNVVSTFPVTRRLGYTAAQTRVILDLPPGTLTQRTLIYAVRTHPDKPASTEGRLSANLVKEAESHSQYQARIRRQGHQQWNTRFYRINAKLPPGLTASEVCAESWPGENMVEAAIECVRCWRMSSGHWSSVRARHSYYGYDMKRGRNGVWYATGIFGRR